MRDEARGYPEVCVYCAPQHVIAVRCECGTPEPMLACEPDGRYLCLACGNQVEITSKSRASHGICPTQFEVQMAALQTAAPVQG